MSEQRFKPYPAYKEGKSTLRWSLKEERQEDKGVTHAVLKTIAAFLNTEGGDLLIGVADDGSVIGIETDRLDNVRTRFDVRH